MPKLGVRTKMGRDVGVDVGMGREASMDVGVRVLLWCSKLFYKLLSMRYTNVACT